MPNPSGVPAFGERWTINDHRIQPEPNTGCWLWMRALSPDGYAGVGAVVVSGVKTGRGHRAFWMFRNGPIPEGMVLDHKCRVRCCVNPDHLRVVSPTENTLSNSRGIAAMNAMKTECRRCGGPLTRKTETRKGRTMIVRRCTPCEKVQRAEYGKEYHRTIGKFRRAERRSK